MSNNFLDLYAEMIEAKKAEEETHQVHLKRREAVIEAHEHEWFLIVEKPHKCEYHCPICQKRLETNEKLTNVVHDMDWVSLYRAILERDIEKANKEIEILHEKHVAYLYRLNAFSNIIKKYGYRLNVDTRKIEIIE